MLSLRSLVHLLILCYGPSTLSSGNVVHASKGDCLWGNITYSVSNHRTNHSVSGPPRRIRYIIHSFIGGQSFLCSFVPGLIIQIR